MRLISIALSSAFRSLTAHFSVDILLYRQSRLQHFINTYIANKLSCIYATVGYNRFSCRINIKSILTFWIHTDDIWAANAIYEDYTDNICYVIGVYVMSYVLYNNYIVQFYGC